MSDPKKGTGKKPKGSGRRLYTDENPKDTVSVEFSSAAAIRRTLAKKSFKSKSHKRQSQIINLIHQRTRAAYQNAKDPKVKARLKRALDYAEERKEASKRKTKIMNKTKNENVLHRVIMEELQSLLDEKRKRYPACRPTPSACKERGRGKSWGKKGSKKKNEEIEMEQNVVESIVREELQRALFKPGLMHHVENKIPVSENIYRPGSPCYFNVIKQARDFYKIGLYEAINEEERELLENTSLGEWVIVEGDRVPLDFPLFEDETLDEAKKKKKKKDPPLNKPTRNSGSGKKYKVFVRNPKTGKVKKVTYGDAKGGLKGGWNDPAARKSFAARHKCAQKKDKTKPGYWACRAHRDFGPGVGRFW